MIEQSDAIDDCEWFVCIISIILLQHVYGQMDFNR